MAKGKKTGVFDRWEACQKVTFAAYSLRSIAAKVFTPQKTQKKQNSKKPLLG